LSRLHARVRGKSTLEGLKLVNLLQELRPDFSQLALILGNDCLELTLVHRVYPVQEGGTRFGKAIAARLVNLRSVTGAIVTGIRLPRGDDRSRRC
jgi:hypothetical protein